MATAYLMKDSEVIDLVHLDKRDTRLAWKLFFQFTDTTNYDYKKIYSIKWEK